MPTIALVFRLWIWFTFRHMRLHFRQVLAVLLGIGLGAAVFTSVRLAVVASVHSFSRSMESIAGKSDWTVVSHGDRVPETLVAELLKNPAVLHACPIMTTYARAAEQPDSVFMLIGIDPVLDRPFRTWQESPSSASSSTGWVDLMAKPSTFFVGARLARRFDLQKGGMLVIEHLQQKMAFRSLGTLTAEGLALVDGGEIAVTDIASFQEFTGCFGAVDRIDLILRPGVTNADLASIASSLPAGITLERPSEMKESGVIMIRSYQLNLSVLSFVSLFVGMFLVYSLIALHTKARRSELAIMRSLGASSRLVFLLFLAEGAFFGVIGWLLAMPLGAFLVKELLKRVSSTITHLFVRVQGDDMFLDPWEVAASLLVTVLVCLLAAAQPARQAMLVPPREALMIHEGGVRDHSSHKHITTFGMVLILLVWPVSQLPAIMEIPFPGYLATFLLFVGFSLLSPWCLQVVGTYSAPKLRRVFGESAQLGGRYVRDAGTRAAISVGALITAVALFVGLVIMVHSFRNTVKVWVEESMNGDLFLRPKMAGVNRYRDPLPQGTAAALKKLKTPVTLMPYRRIFLHYGKNLYQFESLDFHTFMRHGRFLFVDGDPEKILPELAMGRGVVISEVFAYQSGMGVGDRFQTQIQSAYLDIPVLGIFRDYRTQGGAVYYSLPHFQESTGDMSWSGVRIFLSDQSRNREASAERLRTEILDVLGAEVHTVEIMTGKELHGAIMQIFDETFAVTSVLLMIALLVATLGIATTLTVLVLERTRQLHTLIAVGASFRQIRTMVFWEAILMVFTGEAIGLACGFFLSALLIFVINRQSFGWTLIYGIDWLSISLSLPLILLTALVAAIPAVQTLFKRSPAQVLKER